jgi:hypothetical protein
MSRRAAAFTEADFRRACRAAPDRTIEVRLPDGTIIRAVPGKGDEVKPVANPREVRL